MASNEAYSVACIEIFSRLWAELDQLWAQDATMHLQILRLELAILLDACDSPRWKLLLDGEQRRSLRSTLEDVLGDLAGAAHAAPRLPVEWAQNRLLDAIRATRSACDGALVEQPWRRTAS